MTVDILIWALTVICLAAGVVFVLIPVLPGTLIAYAGVVVYAVHDGFAVVTVTGLVVLGVLAVAGVFVDNVLNLVGAKAFGASWAGLIGVFAGLIIGGILLFPIGLFIGPFAGALVAELIRGRSRGEAFKAGLGAFLGYLAGIFAKLAICAAITAYFVVKVIMR